MMPTLKTILRMNAASCLGFGVLFLFQAAPVAAFLGAPPIQFIGLLGAALVLNGIHLLYASQWALPSKYLILYFSGGDFLWVLGTLGLLSAGVWITQPGGQIAALAVAVFVGAMGVMQMKARKALGHC